MQRWFHICKQVHVIHHIPKLKNKKNHKIVSIDAENLLTKYNIHL